jgi:N-glycosylase/DNA lyase
MNKFSVQISDGPLDLDRIARSGQMFRWVKRGEVWAIYDGDHLHSVEQDGEVLLVQSNQTVDVFRSLLRLDENHAEKLKEIIRCGPELESCLDHLSGMRMMRPACAHETLFSFLCSANNHISRITAMVWKLTGSGTPPTANDAVPFLLLDQIASLSEAELRQQGFGYRAKTIPKVAQALTTSFEDLKVASYEDARAGLLALSGIGPKLADCICLFAFDHQEAVPIDTHIWQQLTKIYYPDWQGTALTKAKYDYAAEAFRDRFGSLAGAAHQFLFVENMTSYRKKNLKT